MRKLVLLVFAAAATSMAFAQNAQEKLVPLKMNTEQMNAKTATESFRSMDMKGQTQAAAPRYTYENGVYYTRPVGTYWLGGQTSAGQVFNYLVLPAYTNLTFGNKAGATATWSIGSTALPDFTGKDLVNYYPPSNGYVYGAPTITVGSNSYSVAEGQVLPLDSIQWFYPYDVQSGGRYTGYNDGSYFFGTGTFTTDLGGGEKDYPCHAVFQYIQKPATPMQVYSIETMFVTKSALPLTNGAQLTLYITKVKQSEEPDKRSGFYAMLEDTTQPYTDTLVATAENVEVMGTFQGTTEQYGKITFAKMVEDEFGGKVAAPFVINDEFGVLIAGFGDNGVDCGLMGTEQGANAVEYYNGAQPTWQYHGDEENNFSVRSWVKTAQGDLICRSFVFNFNAFMDGIMFASNNATMTLKAPNAGGTAVDDEGHVCQVFSSLPFLDKAGNDLENYTLLNVPEWLTYSIDESNRAEYGTVITFTAQALPSDVTGRQCKIIIKSLATGIESIVYVLQGNATLDAIDNVAVDNKINADAPMYNLAGQKVNNSYKGVVIQDGKKFIKK